MYDVFLTNGECRMHRKLNYDAALKCIYRTNARFNTVYVNGVSIIEGATVRRAFLTIVRHYNRSERK